MPAATEEPQIESLIAAGEVIDRVAPSVVWANGRRQPSGPLTPEELEVVNDPEMNDIEAFLLSCPQTQYPLREIFIPKNGKLDSGMYVREVELPAGVFYTTEIHGTRHPFCIPIGHVKMWTRKAGWTELVGPFLGITEPPARRLITTLQKTIWQTYHAINGTDSEVLKERLCIPHAVTAVCSPSAIEKITNIIRGLK